MLGDAQRTQDMAQRLFEEGVYVSGFFFPVVPREQARIRTQMNAALTRGDLDRALHAFEVAGKAIGALA
jgi:glycine C-acetyltransferase